MAAINVFMARYFAGMALLLTGVLIHIGANLIGLRLTGGEKKAAAMIFITWLSFIAGFIYLAMEFYNL